MKYGARVTSVLHDGIHSVATGMHDHTIETIPLPVPTRVEIAVAENGHAMLYRYQDDGRFCGDTWHATLEDAFQQAVFEYGIPIDRWQPIG
jgi:hypothetical protein